MKSANSDVILNDNCMSEHRIVDIEKYKREGLLAASQLVADYALLAFRHAEVRHRGFAENSLELGEIFAYGFILKNNKHD